MFHMKTRFQVFCKKRNFYGCGKKITEKVEAALKQSDKSLNKIELEINILEKISVELTKQLVDDKVSSENYENVEGFLGGKSSCNKK